MIDLDVPRNNTRVPLLHWFVADVTTAPDSNVLSIPTTNDAIPGASYIQPSPPVGDLPHRYTFILFPQPADFSVPPAFAAINPPADVQARIGFDVGGFAIAAGLGPVIAASYITVQNLTGTATTTFPGPSPAPTSGAGMMPPPMTTTGMPTGTGAPAAATSMVPFEGAAVVGAQWSVVAGLVGGVLAAVGWM